MLPDLKVSSCFPPSSRSIYTYSFLWGSSMMIDLVSEAGIVVESELRGHDQCRRDESASHGVIGSFHIDTWILDVW